MTVLPAVPWLSAATLSVVCSVLAAHESLINLDRANQLPDSVGDALEAMS
ncbi:MAG: hypothetical protein OXH85_10545 [Truepera sp.]|nr:hypothetical protein [Truepera sp.]